MILFELVVVRGDLVKDSSDLLGLILLFFCFFDVFASLLFQLLFFINIRLLPFSLLRSEVVTTIVIVVVATSTSSVLISTRVVVIVALSIASLLLVAGDFAVLEGPLRRLLSFEDFDQDIS